MDNILHIPVVSFADSRLSFYRVGGVTRIAGFMLGIANVVLLLIGTGPIAYIRMCIS